MGSYRTYGILDDQSVDLGDSGFAGINAKEQADHLEPGLAADALNKDFADNTAATRRGFQSVRWAEMRGVNFPIDFPFDFDVRMGFREVYGVGVFSDPYNQEITLVAVRSGTYRIAANMEPVFIPLPMGEHLTAKVRFVQCFEKVLMLRGSGAATLEWKPANDFNEGLGSWESITMTDSRNSDDDNSYGDGTTQIPDSAGGCLMGNRLFLIVGRDEIVVSDILDYTRYNEATQRFKINQGSDDYIVRLVPWNETTMIVFMNQSVHLLYNVGGDLSEVASDILTAERGLVSAEAVFAAGKDVGFLSDDGVWTIGQVLDNKLQAGAVALSAPIEPWIKRINWHYAGDVCAVTHDEKTYLAVPFDGAKINNVLLVFDWHKRAWAGRWTFDGMDVLSFFKADRGGRRRLFILNGHNLATLEFKGAVYLAGNGFADDIYGVQADIADSLTTRAYTAGTIDDKTFSKTIADIST